MKRVKLRADCYVGGELRKKGDTVEMPDEIAVLFGEEVAAKTAAAGRRKK